MERIPDDDCSDRDGNQASYPRQYWQADEPGHSECRAVEEGICKAVAAESGQYDGETQLHDGQTRAGR